MAHLSAFPVTTTQLQAAVIAHYIKYQRPITLRELADGQGCSVSAARKVLRIAPGYIESSKNSKGQWEVYPTREILVHIITERET